MKNWRLHQELRQCVDGRGRRLTVSLLARALGLNRARLSETLSNKPGHGGQTRPKVVEYLRRKFPDRTAAILRELNWDAQGNQLPAPPEDSVPRATLFSVEQGGSTPHPGPLPGRGGEWEK